MSFQFHIARQAAAGSGIVGDAECQLKISFSFNYSFDGTGHWERAGADLISKNQACYIPLASTSRKPCRSRKLRAVNRPFSARFFLVAPSAGICPPRRVVESQSEPPRRLERRCKGFGKDLQERFLRLSFPVDATPS